MSTRKSPFLSNLKDILIITGFLIFLMAPLGHPKFFWSHDEAQLLWRITEFHQNTMEGIPFARWFPDFARGLGLPFLEYFPVFFLAIAEIFNLLGFPIITSAKMAIFGSSVFGAYFCFKFSSQYWGRLGGLLSGILFSYAPYRIADLYIRGDVNEYTAMSLLPFNLWVMHKMDRAQNSLLYQLLLTFGIGALLITHYPSVIIQLPLYAFYFTVLSLSSLNFKKIYFQYILSLLTALIITSPWWATAFFNRHLVQMQQMTKGFADFSEQFIYPFQWFSFYWNYGASVKGSGDTFPFQLGNASLILIAVSAPVWLKRMKLKFWSQSGSVWPLLLPLMVALFLMTSSSRFLWSAIPVLPMLQFPYRFLQIPAFILAVWAGAYGNYFEEKHPKYNSIILVVMGTLVVLFSSNMSHPATYLNLENSDLIPRTVARVAHTHCTNEFTPAGVGKRFPPFDPAAFTVKSLPDDAFTRRNMEEKLKKRLEEASDITYVKEETIRLGTADVTPKAIEIIEGVGKSEIIRQIACRLEISTESDQATRYRFGQFYFEGWTAILDSKPLTLQADEQTGLISFNVPAGSHRINLSYGNLVMSQYLNIAASISFLVYLFIILWLRKSR